jgi:hypothetical protein
VSAQPVGRKQESTDSTALLHALELLRCVCWQTPLTMSANQLHVNETIIFMTSSQKFTSQLLGKCMQLLVYALLFDINQTSYNKECFVSKHPLVTKIKLCRGEKSMLLHSISMSIADMLVMVDFFHIQKNVMLAILLLLLHIGGIEAKALE